MFSRKVPMWVRSRQCAALCFRPPFIRLQFPMFFFFCSMFRGRRRSSVLVAERHNRILTRWLRYSEGVNKIDVDMRTHML